MLRDLYVHTLVSAAKKLQTPNTNRPQTGTLLTTDTTGAALPSYCWAASEEVELVVLDTQRQIALLKTEADNYSHLIFNC